MKTILAPFSYLFILIIRIYQHAIAPLLGPACRYTPSCSEYGVEAFRRHGVFKGFYLTVRRISRCHPWGGHGHDPVPEAKTKKN